MQRVLEIIFSRWLLLVALFIIPLVIAMGYVMAQPRQYEGSATIWALRRYTVVGATGPESDLTATPASTQALAITEILQTKAFAVAIGHEANLASTYSAATRADPDKVDAAIFDDLSVHVQATATGYNLVTITYDNRSPAMARAVVKAVIDQYGISAAQFAVSESKQLLLIYQQQLQQAQDASNQATAAATSYLREHPAAATNHDPEYNVLQTNASNALQAVSSVQGVIDQINTEVATIGTGSNTLFSVVDHPSVGISPISRTKTLLTGGAIGLAVGLLFCIILVVVTMRRDRSIYSIADLERISEVPVLLQIPQMSPRVLALTVKRLESSERHF